MTDILPGAPGDSNPTAGLLPRLSPADRDLVAALDDHAAWMILHDDDCADDACTGCVDRPPLNPIAELDVPLAQLEAGMAELLRLRREAAAAEADLAARLRAGLLAEYGHWLHDADPDSTVPVFPCLDKGFTPERAA